MVVCNGCLCPFVKGLTNCAAPMLAGPCNAGVCQTHLNMPGSWPKGRCNCLAHNSDWLEYQRREANPKQLLTRDIKQSGESCHRDFMMPPGKHVLAHTEALFNTIAAKQLITQSKKKVTLLSPRATRETLSPVTKWQSVDLWYYSSILIHCFLNKVFVWMYFSLHCPFYLDHSHGDRNKHRAPAIRIHISQSTLRPCLQVNEASCSSKDM